MKLTPDYHRRTKALDFLEQAAYQNLILTDRQVRALELILAFTEVKNAV